MNLPMVRYVFPLPGLQDDFIFPSTNMVLIFNPPFTCDNQDVFVLLTIIAFEVPTAQTGTREFLRELV